MTRNQCIRDGKKECVTGREREMPSRQEHSSAFKEISIPPFLAFKRLSSCRKNNSPQPEQTARKQQHLTPFRLHKPPKEYPTPDSRNKGPAKLYLESARHCALVSAVNLSTASLRLSSPKACYSLAGAGERT
jgi:hypothetical protein